MLLNAAAAIAAFDGEKDLGIHERLTKSLQKATTAVDSGAAISLLEKWVLLTQEIASD